MERRFTNEPFLLLLNMLDFFYTAKGVNWGAIQSEMQPKVLLLHSRLATQGI